jgi:hypothetical protein
LTQVRLTEQERLLLNSAVCDCNDEDCFVREDYSEESLVEMVEYIIANRLAREEFKLHDQYCQDWMSSAPGRKCICSYSKKGYGW